MVLFQLRAFSFTLILFSFVNCLSLPQQQDQQVTSKSNKTYRALTSKLYISETIIPNKYFQSRPSKDGRIVGGTPTQISSFPYQVRDAFLFVRNKSTWEFSIV